MQVWPGQAFPLGATYDGIGTNFSVFSEVAERVELCLFDDAGREERVDLSESNGFCWHSFLPGVGPGQRYGYRLHGPSDPRSGLRCNPSKLLIDPYAKAIDGGVSWNPAVYPYPLGGDDSVMNTEDSAPFVPRSVVINLWGNVMTTDLAGYSPSGVKESPFRSGMSRGTPGPPSAPATGAGWRLTPSARAAPKAARTAGQ